MRLFVTLSVSAVLALAPTAAGAATAVDTNGTTYSTDRVVVPLVFPVVGPTSLADTFLACRSGCSRKHMGQDLMGPKMSPLVAACDGTVTSVRRETAVGGGNYLTIACDHGPGAGWSVFYLHVNNDTPGTDDGKGTRSWAFPAGIVPGVRVLAGQLVAWRGDSGDAESTGPHLHFELRKGTGWGGTVYNAFPSLRAARHLAAPSISGPHPDGTLLRSTAGQLFAVAQGVKHPVTAGVLAANGLSAAAAVTTNLTEFRAYRTGAPLPLRDGALVRDPEGAAWRVLGQTRFPATPAAGQRVVPVTAEDLAGLVVTDVPVSPLSTGMLVRVAGMVYAVADDGLLRPASPSALVSWGATAADVVDLPADLPLPAVGAPLGLRDGTLVDVPGVGAGVVSGGEFRRLWNLREIASYGYGGKQRLSVPRSAVAGLAVTEIAAQAYDSGHRRPRG